MYRYLFIQILLQVWPNVNHYARSLLKDSIEPAVAESLANYKLNGFKFERMILGTIVSIYIYIKSFILSFNPHWGYFWSC